ncbi:hypothetical protein [Rhodoferax saidenbachensis]
MDRGQQDLPHARRPIKKRTARNGGSPALTDGQQPTMVSFPPTGSWTTPGTVSLMQSLAKEANTLTFGIASG